MLSLEETLAVQENLAELCADRPLLTNETFPPNAFYGTAFILREYAQLPPHNALKVAVPHGTYLSESYLWEAEKMALVPMILCYPQYREGIYARETKKQVVPSAAPFVYLLELMKHQPERARMGTIFFPLHSTHHVTAEMNLTDLAQNLLKLEDKYRPITVCLYWRDYNLGRHLPFQKCGLRVVSAGHIYDPLFLFRFYHLCSTHRYAASNEIGSSLFYSVKAGCSFFFFEAGPATVVASPEILKRDTALPSSKREAELRSLFQTPQPHMTDRQMQVVDYYLGTKYRKSSAGLRRQLRFAEFMDRFGFVVWNSGMLPRIVTPSKYRREGSLPLYKKYSWTRQKLSGLKRRIRQLVRS